MNVSPLLFMKQTLYFIPGLGEHCNLMRYRHLKKALQSRGYNVVCVNPNWYKPISEQIFRIEKNDIIIDFSFGAILAYLIAKKYPCRKIILASISPIHTFSYSSLVKDFHVHMPKDLAVEITEDIKKIKISLNSLKTHYITLAGQLENVTADFIIPNTGHRMTNTYIKRIQKLV